MGAMPFFFIDERTEPAVRRLRGHDRASEETKGLIPRRTFGSHLPRKAASNRRFEAVGAGLCPAV